uniref:Uncharacterized protein n=1 Tax=Meloidogyne enterolobii TaxID=390850 RepID=A0A6V7V792_MELEN|nr:unnamed protein product [Meloidogyne enterolobii]
MGKMLVFKEFFEQMTDTFRGISIQKNYFLEIGKKKMVVVFWRQASMHVTSKNNNNHL